jgi:hypothetical protein
MILGKEKNDDRIRECVRMGDMFLIERLGFGEL